MIITRGAPGPATIATEEVVGICVLAVTLTHWRHDTEVRTSPATVALDIVDLTPTGIDSTIHEH